MCTSLMGKISSQTKVFMYESFLSLVTLRNTFFWCYLTLIRIGVQLLQVPSCNPMQNASLKLYESEFTDCFTAAKLS